MDIDAPPLSETQLTGSANARENQASIQESKLRTKRIQLRIIAKGIANVGDVPRSPVTHESHSKGDYIKNQQPRKSGPLARHAYR
jgi:hypothetical protein